MKELIEIGFEKAGEWFFEGGKINFKLNRFYKESNVLYAFIVGGRVKYVGKTTTTLSRRFYGYRNPQEGQQTNVKNNKNIFRCLGSGVSVDIYVLPDNGLMHYGMFHLSLASGLEDSIIYAIKPPWNGRAPKEFDEDFEEVLLEDYDFPYPCDSFNVLLGKTYYENGVFNVPKDKSSLFGGHDDVIEIYVKDNPDPVVGYISRKAQSTGSPRVYGRLKLAELFQENYKLNDSATVQILSKDAIRFV